MLIRLCDGSLQIFILATSVVEHYCALAPSTLLGFYDLAFVLFSCAELRTLGMIGLQGEKAFVAKGVATGGVLAMLLLEIVPKRRLLKDEYKVRRNTSSFKGTRTDSFERWSQ